MIEGWKRWLAVVRMVAQQSKADDAKAVLDIVKTGIRMINDLDQMIREVTGRIERNASTTYKAIKLPLAGNDLT